MSKLGRVNIPRSVVDPAYRYTMEKMDVERAGRGGNSHTIIKNIEQLAKDLNTLPAYIIKYFGLELGTESFYEANKMPYVSGHHQTEDLNKILDKFIKIFICCEKCSLPELFMSVNKKDQTFLTCQACGHNYEVIGQDKMCKFILKNKPPKKTIKGKETNKMTEQAKEEEQTEAAPAKEEDKASASAENAEQKPEEEVNPVDVLQAFLQRKSNATEEEIITAVKAMKGIYGLKEKTLACLLCEALLSSEKVEILPLVEKYAPIFAHFIKKEAGQEKILGYIESFCSTDLNMPKISLILEKLYDAGVLSEPVVMSWFSEKKSKFVKKASVLQQIKMSAKPFVDWLEQAQIAEAK